MDLLCPICGEPWDNDTFHDRSDETGATYRDTVRAFQREGCLVLGVHCADTQAAPGIGELYDLLGDDFDGAASLLEDFGGLL